MAVTEARSGAAVRGSGGANHVSVLGLGRRRNSTNFSNVYKWLEGRGGERNDNRRVHGE
jgi:hypothetical protein